MTSHQLRTKLQDAVDILALCEDLLDDPYSQERHWELVDLKHRVIGFLDLHRQTIADGSLS